MTEHIVTIILDTNVFVAAYWKPSGTSARLMSACIQGRLEAHSTEALERETRYILGKIKAKPEFMSRVDAYFSRATKVEPAEVKNTSTEDPDDQKFLEAARGAGTDFIVSSDDHLLSVGFVGRTQVLTPHEAAQVLGPQINGGKN